MPLTFQVAIDCTDPHGLADWWAETLGWQVEDQDADFIRKMVAEGHAGEEDTTTHNGALVWREGAAIVSGPPGSLRMYFQAVPEPKTVKNRMHLDLRGVDDVAALRERLRERGAAVVYEGRQGPHTWVTMTDPEGNEFCV